MDCLGVEVAVLDTCRPKRLKKLSLSLSGKIAGMEEMSDAGKKELMGKDCEDCGDARSFPEHQLLSKRLSPTQASSPPKESQVPKAGIAVRRSPQQKQGCNPRRRKAQDKNCNQENGTITGPSEFTKNDISETFFMPVSKKRKLLAEENNLLASNQGTKRTVEALKDVPAKAASVKAKLSALQRNSPAAKKTSSKAPSGSSQVSVSVLRAKAALDAKEDAIRNAGKAIHPLFVRVKTSAAKVAASSCEVGFLEPCPPMHVTQCSEEGKVEPNWGDTYVHLPSPVERCKEETLVHRLIQGGHNLEDDLLMSRSSEPTRKNLGTLSENSALRLPYSDASSQQGLEDLLEYLQQNTEPKLKALGASLQSSSEGSVDRSTSIEKLKEGLSWYNARRDSLRSRNDKGTRSSQENTLWTDVYVPKSSKEVCGNATGVGYLNNWMQSWRERMTGQVNSSDLPQKNSADRRVDSDCDRGWFEGDSDVDTDDDEESDLHSTLLVTGPTGCGKTAAVYACAEEQGLTVIEVNASSCRSGASLMQKFGKGGLESQAMGKWSTVEDQMDDDEGCTLPHTRGNFPPQVRGKEKKEGKPRATRGSKNSRVPGDKSAVGLNGHEENPEACVEEPQTANAQKKKMTVILFEDVDLQFEEDRGFLTSLVQLAKKTKRPIILTSNSRQPGLPQILEKARIDFSYPSPEELTLHASMVCIAEGVACSPWMVNRLVESCQCDMRKLIMSLQFWKQGGCSSPTPSLHSTLCDSNGLEDMSEKSVTEDCNAARRRLSLRPGLLDSTAQSFSPEEKENRWLKDEAVSAFRQWDSEARYLYEHDIHHIILPHYFSGSDPCLLSLEVARSISAAVSELGKHESTVAVRNAEQQGLALQAKLNAADAERKAQRRAKDAMRRASRVKTNVVQEGAAVFANLSSNNDTESEFPAFKSQFMQSPLEGIREARALARSPLKGKLQRGFLLNNSEKEEAQAAQGQADDHIHCLFGLSNPHSGGIQVTKLKDGSDGSPENVVITNNIEDKDVVMIASCESVAAVSRMRLPQVLESSLQGSRIPRREVRDEDLQSIAATYSRGPESSSRRILSSSPTVGAEMDENRLADGLYSVAGSSLRDEDQCENQDQSCGRRALLETNNLVVMQAEKAKPRGERIIFDVDLNLPPCWAYDEHVKYVKRECVNACIPGDIELCSTVQNSVGFVGSRVLNTSGDDNGSGLGSNDVNVTGAEKSECSEVENSTSRSSLSQIRPSGDDEGYYTTDGAVLVETQCENVNPVQEAWKALRDERDTFRHLLMPVQPNIHESDALATVLDTISSSDMISSFASESRKAARSAFGGAWNGAFEGNIGHCNYWEDCQEMASQLVRAGLQTFSAASLMTFHDNRLPVAVGILSAAKDVPAVGQCMINCDDVNSIRKLATQLGSTGKNCSKEESTRQSRRQERLDEIVRTLFHPKGRIAGASLSEYVAYLALINRLEEERRRSQAIHDKKRSRRFQHHLNSKMSDADIEEFGVLSRFVKA